MRKLRKESWRVITIGFVVIGLTLSVYPLVAGNGAISGDWKIQDATPIDLTELVVNGQVTNYFMTPIDPDYIDQYMIETNPNSGITSVIAHSQRAWAQRLVNDRDPLTGFQIAVARHGNPNLPLYIGIMAPVGSNSQYAQDPRYGDNYLWLAQLDANVLPEAYPTFYWIGADLGDGFNRRDQTFWFVTVSDHVADDDNLWMWAAYYDGNNYDRGELAEWKTEDTAWTYDGFDDGFFISYTTENSQPPPEEPDITISMSTWVVSAFGLGFLGMAVISGTKYFGVL